MHKKLMMACMAIAAFAAFVIAPAASATTLTDAGSALATGKKIVGTNTKPSVLTINGGGTVECSSAVLTGTLTENGPSVVKGDISSATFTGTGSGGDCTSSLGDMRVTVPSLPWCLSTVKGTDTFTVTGGNCGESKPVTFILDATSLGNIPCAYAKSSVTGTFTTSATTSVLTVEGQEFTGSGEGNSFLCPTGGKLDMTMILETDGTNTELGIS